jgi:hypothetical protein
VQRLGIADSVAAWPSVREGLASHADEATPLMLVIDAQTLEATFHTSLAAVGAAVLREGPSHVLEISELRARVRDTVAGLRGGRAGAPDARRIEPAIRDVFISHASEDKTAVARPLAERLVAGGLTVWYDEFALSVGDSLMSEIDRGLRVCRFGVVVLSHRFFGKEWARRELAAMMAREAADGTKRVLPIWHGVSRDDVYRYSPTLAERLAISTEAGLDAVVEAISAAVAEGKRQLSASDGP